jgi:two-component system chemotaxis response regulator CheY
VSKLPNYENKKFLIVDDENFMLGVIERMLKQCRAGLIVKALDGGTGLKSINDNLSQVDCIISDCNMKPINGLQFLQAVRAGVNPRIPREQPFVMLTGHGDSDVVKNAIELDVSSFVVKPVAMDKLIQGVERALQRSVTLKDEQHYKAIKLAKIQVGPETNGVSAPKAWVLLPRGRPFKTSADVQSKIDQFKREHATRDGEEPVRLKNRRVCDISDLKEGQVLAQNVEAEEGVILLREGVHLDRLMIERLKAIVVAAGAAQEVWVGELEG